MENYITNNERFNNLPCIKDCIAIIDDVRNIIFPGYFECVDQMGDIEDLKLQVMLKLKVQINKAAIIAHLNLNEEALATAFINQIPEVTELLKTDLQATFAGDPAARDLHEIIISYPGFYAIIVHRIAHVLYRLGIPYISRIMSEHAHSITGIDIHPGATIDHSFCIDHGTGIVIGETSIIGHHVRIYQGVTIGALSLGRGQLLKGIKRHPTIGNHVTIYSGASILGGETIIGDNVTVGSNTYILESIPENSRVRLAKVDVEITKKHRK